MRPPLVYRAVLNPLRAWLEDRRAPEYGYVQQFRAWWRADDGLEHRTRRPRSAGTALVGRRSPAARFAWPLTALSAVSLGTMAGWALSRLLGVRRRPRVDAGTPLNLLVVRGRKKVA